MSRPFVSNSPSNFRAFPSSPLDSHVFIFPAYHVFRPQHHLSLVEYLYDFPLLLLDLCCITLSVNLLEIRWAGGRSASGAAGGACIMDFGFDTLRLKRSAIGLGVEILIIYKFALLTYLDCRKLRLYYMMNSGDV